MGIMINCKEATTMISKKEEGKISFIERIQLWQHLLICSLCKLFMKQNKLIASLIPEAEKKSVASLSDKEKQQIVDAISNAN